jgi:hypothetical protein
MDERSELHDRLSQSRKGRAKGARARGAAAFVAGLVWVACAVLPAVANAGDVLVCQELKAAVADAQRGFAAHKGALAKPGGANDLLGKRYQAKKFMTGATVCHVVDVSLDKPKMRQRQTSYRCQFPAVLQLDKSLRAELRRCVAGEVDDPSDPYDFTIWVERVSSGEGYRATEVTAVANLVDGMTLWVRQSVCTNQGGGQACED